jgi:drug/metabolite transporter (DMT)-like permease
MPEVPALQQAAFRSLGGAFLVWLWSRWRGIALFKPDGTLPGGLLAGLLFAAEFGCIFIGLQFTSASRMVVFIYLSPFVVALGMPFIAKSERLSLVQLVGLTAAFAGVAWAFAEGFTKPAVGDRQWLGDSLGVVAGVLWGATTLAIRGSRLSSASAEKTLLYQLAISGFALALAALVMGTPLPTQLSSVAWGSLLFQDRHRRLRELPAVVLADAPLPGDAARVVHAAHAGVRPAARRCAARRADHAAASGGAGRGRARHRARQSQGG